MPKFNFKDYSNTDLRDAVLRATLAGVRSAEEKEWRDALLQEYGNRTSAEEAESLLEGVFNRCASWS